MALGKRKREQQDMWVATSDLPKSPRHVFYIKLNRLLDEADFDRSIEVLCRPYYAHGKGRPGIPPGMCFPNRAKVSLHAKLVPAASFQLG